MSQAEVERLWAILDAQRGSSTHDLRLADALQTARDNQMSVTPADVWAIAIRFGRASGATLTPPLVGEFVARLDGRPDDSTRPRSLGRSRDTARDVVAATSPRASWASTRTRRPCEPQPFSCPAATGECVRAEPEASVLDPLEKFDLVVSDLPIGTPIHAFAVGDTAFKDRRDGEILLRSATRLADGGMAIYVVGPRFLVAPTANSAVAQLGKFGLCVDAFFHIPEGAYLPLTSIALGLVVVRRGPASNTIFVGEVTADRARRHLLLANYRRRSAQGPPDLGVCTALAGFRGFRRLRSDYRIEAAGKRLNVPRCRLADVATSIARSGPMQVEPGQSDNILYLPLIASSRVRLPGDAMPKGTRNSSRSPSTPRRRTPEWWLVSLRAISAERFESLAPKAPQSSACASIRLQIFRSGSPRSRSSAASWNSTSAFDRRRASSARFGLISGEGSHRHRSSPSAWIASTAMIRKSRGWTACHSRSPASSGSRRH